MNLDTRRYRIVDGRIHKTFTEDGPEWFKTKAEAILAAGEPLRKASFETVMKVVEDAPVVVKPKRGRPRKK